MSGNEKIEDDISGMSDRALLSAFREEIENVRALVGKEYWATPELLVRMEAQLQGFEHSVRDCEIVNAKAKAAKAKLNRSADDLLKSSAIFNRKGN